VPLAGVVDALERIHAALDDDGGVVVDTQPVSPRPPVLAKERMLGTLDLREWADMVASTDAEVMKTVDAGRFSVVADRHIVVSDFYDDLAELIDEAAGWAGTTVPRTLTRQVDATSGEVRLDQDVRIRVLVKQ
jgi:hypothetical protein